MKGYNNTILNLRPASMHIQVLLCIIRFPADHKTALAENNLRTVIMLDIFLLLLYTCATITTIFVGGTPFFHVLHSTEINITPRIICLSYCIIRYFMSTRNTRRLRYVI